MLSDNEKSNYNIDYNLLKDPITLEIFKYPKILDCGHTFDHDTLKSIINRNIIFKCPLCNKIISERNIEKIPTNWLVCNLLNININNRDRYSKLDIS
jgi:hypothetical protein